MSVVILTIFAGGGDGITACGVGPAMRMLTDQLQLGVVQLRFIPVNIGCEVVGWSFAAHIGLPAGGKSIIAVITGQGHAELRAVCQRAADGDGYSIIQIEIFNLSVGVFAVFVLCPRLHVACYLNISGNGDFFCTITYIYTATGTPMADIVAGNAAAGHGEG